VVMPAVGVIVVVAVTMVLVVAMRHVVSC